MSSLAESPSSCPSVTSTSRALAQVPRRQVQWIGAQMVGTAVLLYALPGLVMEPEWLLILTTALGAAFAHPGRLWTAPVVFATVTLTGLIFMEVNWPPVIGAGAAAGLMATWTLPWRTDAMDHLNGVFAGVIGLTTGTMLGMAAVSAAPETAPAALVGALLIALCGSASLYPAALRFDREGQIPSSRTVQTTLQLGFRPPVFQAIKLYTTAATSTTDAEVRRGLAEVVTWIYRMQCSLQSLHGDLENIDVASVQTRIDALEQPGEHTDPFTRDRHRATAAHLRRLLDHRDKLKLEQHRTESLVAYAIAFLEEARAGLALAKQLPGEAIPNRLNDVLEHLRGQALAGDARRQTAREVEIHPSPSWRRSPSKEPMSTPIAAEPPPESQGV